MKKVVTFTDYRCSNRGERIRILETEIETPNKV